MCVTGSFAISQNVSNDSIFMENESVQTICRVSICPDNSPGNCLLNINLSIVFNLLIIDSTNQQHLINSSRLNTGSVTTVEVSHNYASKTCVVPVYVCNVTGTSPQGDHGNLTKYTKETTVLCKSSFLRVFSSPFSPVFSSEVCLSIARNICGHFLCYL